MTPEQLVPVKPARVESTFLSPLPRPPAAAAKTPDWGALAPSGPYPRWGKRLLRTLLALLVIPFALALSIPIVLINWALFRDLRQVLYRQPRVGRRGRVFQIFKFRTMREAEDGDFEAWSEGSDDLRVTRFGRLLRNTHLDELPQLLNILRGEMDFVGPRPEMIQIHRWACERIPGFAERNALLPGITGYAQITQGYTGMDERAYRKKLAADQLYRRNFSLRFDLEILFRTALWMLRGRGWNAQSGQRPEAARAYARVR